MAVVAGGLDELLYLVRGLVLGKEVSWARAGSEVFRLAYELDCYEKHKQPQQDLFYHEARVSVFFQFPQLRPAVRPAGVAPHFYPPA
jgi:tRNA(His) 5'-end guanylyltransferase